MSITSDRAGEHILFHHEGGVDIGDVDAKALVLDAGIGGEVTHEQALNLVRNLPAERREGVATFVRGLLKMYRDLHFCLLEINPLVMQADGSVLPLDVAAKVCVWKDATTHTHTHASAVQQQLTHHNRPD